MITYTELTARMDYNPDTGKLTWKIGKPGLSAGSEAGYLHPDGYRKIKIHGKLYTAARLAYLLMIGDWPEECIDHINGLRDDNRWCNLRPATYRENALNRPALSRNQLGIKGVCYRKQTNRYRASISINGRLRELGNYHTAEEASLAYKSAAEKYHGEFVCLLRNR